MSKQDIDNQLVSGFVSYEQGMAGVDRAVETPRRAPSIPNPAYPDDLGPEFDSTAARDKSANTDPRVMLKGPDGIIVADASPTLSESRSAVYEDYQLVHLPANITSYVRSDSRSFTLGLNLVSRNEHEALVNHGYLNLARSWLLPTFGKGPGIMGTTPPILKLTGFRDLTLQVVLTQYSWDWPNTVDYIWDTPEPMPIIGTLSLTLVGAYSAQQLADGEWRIKPPTVRGPIIDKLAAEAQTSSSSRRFDSDTEARRRAGLGPYSVGRQDILTGIITGGARGVLQGVLSGDMKGSIRSTVTTGVLNSREVREPIRAIANAVRNPFGILTGRGQVSEPQGSTRNQDAGGEFNRPGFQLPKIFNF